MSQVFEKFVALPAVERRFAVGAWCLAPIVELSLRGFGLARTLSGIDWLTRRAARVPARVPVQRGAALVDAAYRRHVLAGRCLPRSLVQYLLHRAQGDDVQVAV